MKKSYKSTKNHSLHNSPQSKKTRKIEITLKKKIKSEPGNLGLKVKYAEFLTSLNRNYEAAKLFKSKKSPSEIYNYGFYLKKSGLYDIAIKHLKKSISLGISRPETAWLEVGNCYREMNNDIEAEKCYLHCLELNSKYSPSRINLANLYSDHGDLKKSIVQLKKIKEEDPLFPIAISRLSYILEEDLKTKLEACLYLDTSIDVKCDILYSLGHHYLREGSYSKSWSPFKLANKLNKKLLPNYSIKETQNRLSLVTSKQIKPPKTKNTNKFKPIFICGNFRSGSTLLEQLLAFYDDFFSVGELNILNELPPATNIKSNTVRNAYLNKLQAWEPSYKNFIEKSCNNIWHIDLIFRAFPNSTVVITKRDFLDNAISIFNHRFGTIAPYSCSPEEIAHYYACIEYLTEYWASVFPNIIIIEYEKLVTNPQPEIDLILTRFGKSWSDQCLNYYKSRSIVKTASSLQVRKPLYTTAIGYGEKYIEFSNAATKAYRTAIQQLTKI